MPTVFRRPDNSETPSSRRLPSFEGTSQGHRLGSTSSSSSTTRSRPNASSASPMNIASTGGQGHQGVDRTALLAAAERRAATSSKAHDEEKGER